MYATDRDGQGVFDPEYGKPKPIKLSCGCYFFPGDIIEVWEKDGRTACDECIRESLETQLSNGYGVLAHALGWSEAWDTWH